MADFKHSTVDATLIPDGTIKLSTTVTPNALACQPPIVLMQELFDHR